MHWTETPIHIIDFEGTLGTGIIEYGVVTLHHGKVTHTHTRLCKALKTISLYDTSLHGISMSDTEVADPFANDWPLFIELRTGGAFGAHHASTENSFIKNVWPYPRQVPDFSQPNRRHAQWGPWVDTYVLYKTLFPGLQDYKLATLIHKTQQQEALDMLASAHCPEGRKGYHRALYDALASALLLIYLGSLAEHKDISLEWLLAKSSPSAKKWEEQVQQNLF